MSPNVALDIKLRRYTEDRFGNARSASSVPDFSTYYTFTDVNFETDAEGLIRYRFSPQGQPVTEHRLFRNADLIVDPLNPRTSNLNALPPGRYAVRIDEVGTGCSMKSDFWALSDQPALELSDEFGTRNFERDSPDLSETLELWGWNFEPNASVSITTKDPNGAPTAIFREETGAYGEFHVINLHQRLRASSWLRGPGVHELVATDSLNRRATVGYLLVMPGLEFSMDGALGYPQTGHKLSHMRVSGRGLPPWKKLRVGILKLSGDGSGQSEVTTGFFVHSNRRGEVDHVISETDWPMEDNGGFSGRHDGNYIIKLSEDDLRPYTERGIIERKFALFEANLVSDIRITGIEVTQGIQDMQNSIPLIRGKDTVVRVYFAADTPSRGIVAFLKAYDEYGRELTRSTPNAEQPVANFLRSAEELSATRQGSTRRDIDSTFNFVLPSDWSDNVGPIRFEAILFPRSSDPDRTNNSMDTEVFFRPTTSINITQKRLHTHEPATLPHRDLDEEQIPLEIDRYWYMWQALDTLFPLSRRMQDYRVWKDRALLKPILHFRHRGDEYDNEVENCDWESGILARLDFYDMWTPDPAPEPHFWIGLAPYARCSTAGQAYVPYGPFGGVAIVQYDTRSYGGILLKNLAAETFAHEIAHLLDRSHTLSVGEDNGPRDRNWPYGQKDDIGMGTESGAWGLKIDLNPTSLQVLAPSEARELMSDETPYWISDYTYAGLHYKLNPFIDDWIDEREIGEGEDAYLAYHRREHERARRSEQARRSSRISAQTTQTRPWGIVVSGVFESRENQLRLSNLHRAKTADLISMIETVDSTDSTALLLRVYSKNATETKKLSLSQLQEFDRHFHDKNARETTISKPDYMFSGVYTFKFPPTRVEITTASGDVLYEQSIAGTAPLVKWTKFPRGNMAGKDLFGLAVSTPQSDTHFFELQASHDKGETWEFVEIPEVAQKGRQYEWVMDASNLTGGDDVRFRVLSQDGVHISVVEAPRSISIPNHPPEIELMHLPSSAEKLPQPKVYTVYADGPLPMQVRVTDREDRTVERKNIQWYSDKIGFLGYGHAVPPRLPSGSHTITVTARDSSGASSSHVFEAEVRHLAAQ